MRMRGLAFLVGGLLLAGTTVPAQAASNRPTIAVMDFDYGAVNNWWSGVWGNYDIGKGMADQVVDALLTTARTRS